MQSSLSGVGHFAGRVLRQAVQASQSPTQGPTESPDQMCFYNIPTLEIIY